MSNQLAILFSGFRQNYDKTSKKTLPTSSIPQVLGEKM